MPEIWARPVDFALHGCYIIPSFSKFFFGGFRGFQWVVAEKIWNREFLGWAGVPLKVGGVTPRQYKTTVARFAIFRKDLFDRICLDDLVKARPPGHQALRLAGWGRE
jgi:hypothetical protein